MSRTDSIQIGRLLKRSFNYAKPVYGQLLALFLPNLIITLIEPTINSISASLFLSLINFVCITPFLTGASIFYIHQNLISQGATIPDSLQKAGERFIQLAIPTILFVCILFPVLILITLFPIFVLFLIPLIYLAVRFSFVYYAVMIENRSAFDALGRGWRLMRGRWWQIVLAVLLLFLVILIPAIILGTVLGLMLGPNFQSFETIGGILGYFFSPIFSTYYVFLFFALVGMESA